MYLVQSQHVFDILTHLQPHLSQWASPHAPNPCLWALWAHSTAWALPSKEPPLPSALRSPPKCCPLTPDTFPPHSKAIWAHPSMLPPLYPCHRHTYTHRDVGTWEQNEFWMPLEVQKPINGKKSQRHFSPTSNAEGRGHFVKEVFLQLTQEQHTQYWGSRAFLAAEGVPNPLPISGGSLHLSIERIKDKEPQHQNDGAEQLRSGFCCSVPSCYRKGIR